MKKLLAIFVAAASTTLAALHAAEPSTTPVLRIEPGMHTSPIRRLSTDTAGRMMLTVSDDKTARLWELPSGRLVRILRPPLGEGNDGKLYCGALSADGSLAIVAGWTSPDAVGATDTAIYFFDTSTGRLLQRIAGLPSLVNELALSPQGRFVAVLLGTGEGLRVFETTNGREVGQDKDYANSLSLGLDWYGEDRLVSTCYDGQLRLYRVAAKTVALMKKSPVKGGKIPLLARFSPDGKSIAVGFEDSTVVTVVDSNTLSFLFSPDLTGVNNGDLSKVAWTDDGALAAGGRWRPNVNCTIRRWSDGGRGSPRDTEVNSQNTIMDLRPLPGGQILYGASDPAWGVVTKAAGSARPRIQTVAVKGGLVPNLGASPLADFRDSHQILRVSDDGGTVAFGYEYLGRSPARFSIADRQLELLKEGATPAGLRAVRQDGLNITDWQDNYSPKLGKKPIELQQYEMSRSLAVAANKSSFLLGSEWNLRRYTSTGVERWNIPIPGSTWSVNLADRDRLALAAYGDGTIRWHRYDDGQELLAFFPHADRKRWVLWATEYRTVATDKPYWGADWKQQGEKYYLRNVQPDSPAARAGVQEGDLFVKYLDDVSEGNFKKLGGRIRLTVDRGGREFTIDATITARRENRVQAVYYDCSPGGEDLIGWHVNRAKDQASDFYPAAKFREQFYRPDVIRLVLAKGDVSAAVKEANEASGRRFTPDVPVEAVIAKQAPPVVELTVGGALGMVKLPAEADTFAVRYRVRRGAGDAVTRVRVQIDGRPVSIDPPVPTSDTAEVSVTIPVPAEDCLVGVSAENKFAASEPALLRLVRIAPVRPGPTPSIIKPKLYLVAVGVADLKMNDALDMNGDGRVTEEELRVRDPGGTIPFADLHFADADAVEVAAAFKAQEGGLYGKVETRVMVNKEATASAIRDSLDWIKSQTTSRDVAVIFMSGHGENDNEGRFYFLGHDYDRARRKSTGVSFSEIVETVKDPAGKMLFFLDACHAGNALGKMFAAKGGAVDMNGLVNELASAENGAVVFASSTGRQQSLERADLKHGVFAYSIIEGINGKADLLGNGHVTITGLETYLSNRVKELSERQQTPTVAKPQTIPDFPISIKR